MLMGRPKPIVTMAQEALAEMVDGRGFAMVVMLCARCIVPIYFYKRQHFLQLSSFPSILTQNITKGLYLILPQKLGDGDSAILKSRTKTKNATIS